MDATSQQVLTTIALVLSVVAGVALPALTVRRYRNPQRRRDAWLGANAHPVLTRALHVLSAAYITVSSTVVVILGVVFAWPLVWAVIPLTIGWLVAIVIMIVITWRIPPDIAGDDSHDSSN